MSPGTTTSTSEKASTATVFDRIAVGLACVGVLLWTTTCAIAALIGFVLSPKWGHLVHHIWGRGFCWLFGIRVEVIGLENLDGSSGGILAANHQSLFDIPVLASLPVHFRWVSKAEVGRIPLLGWAMRRMGCYFLRRNHSSGDVGTMKQIEGDLQKGTKILIFPEGTRTRTGALLPLKRGAFRTSINSGVPIYPVAISGSYTIAPAGTLPHRRGHRVRVEIGAGLLPSPGLPQEAALEKLTTSYREKLIGMLSAKRY